MGQLVPTEPPKLNAPGQTRSPSPKRPGTILPEDGMMASENKHTPGPWVIARSSKGYPYQIDAPNGSRGPGGITSVTRWAAISLPTSAEGEANARLIAAAPDYDAVARDAIPILEAILEWREEEIEEEDEVLRDLIERFRAAIAKAEGRSNG